MSAKTVTTVGQLIEKLKNFSPDLPVVIRVGDVVSFIKNPSIVQKDGYNTYIGDISVCRITFEEDEL